MILSYQNNKYRISYGGLNLVENAYGNPNLVQVSIVAGTTVQVAPDDHFGIHYRANGEYATWKLDGVNTRIARAAKHYIYARLSRSEDTALLVFSVNRYRVDGKELGPDEEMWPSFTESKKPAPQPGEGGKANTPAEGEPSKDEVLQGPYYYICIGEITESNESATKLREITIDAGYLTTPQGAEGANSFFRLIENNLIQPLMHMASHTIEGTLEIIGKAKERGRILLNGKEINDIARQKDVPATPPTPSEPTTPPTEEEIELKKLQEDRTVPTVGYLKGGFSEELGDKFLRKDRPDKTEFLIKFLDNLLEGKIKPGGVEVGEFIESMSPGLGKGTKIFTNGRIQTRRLEVSDSMTVMDLIINEIHAMAGEFNFSDCGKIEKVEDLGNRTYKIWIEKKFPEDVTSLDVNDVCYSIVNTLLMEGEKGEYYTSWFRVLSRDASDPNILTVVLYSDDSYDEHGNLVRGETPGGKNFAPRAKFNVTRRGNSVLPEVGQINERSQSWLLSSREGRLMFLQNVYMPKLKDFNYSLVLGKLPNISVIDRLGLTDQTGLYAQTVVAENFYSVDWNGDVICKSVDRGEWSKTIAETEGKKYRFIETEHGEVHKTYTLLEQHTVYHFGCKWGCIHDQTLLEPMWNSPDWTLLEGDKNYHISFESSKGGQFFISSVDTELTAKISYGNRDISDALLSTTGVQTEWARDTGMAAADNSWKPRIVGGKPNVIHLLRDDMGSGWGIDYRQVTFIFRVFIPSGDNFETVEERISVKL